MPLKIERSGSAIRLRAQIGSVRWIFLAFGFGVPLLAWSQGHLKLDGSGPLASYLGAFLFVTRHFRHRGGSGIAGIHS